MRDVGEFAFEYAFIKTFLDSNQFEDVKFERTGSTLKVSVKLFSFSKWTTFKIDISPNKNEVNSLFPKKDWKEFADKEVLKRIQEW